MKGGGSLYDRFGPGFTLVAGANTNAQSAAEIAAQLSIPLVIVDLKGEALDDALYAGRLTLVRPDQHVAWRGAVLGKTALRRAVGFGLDEDSVTEKADQSAMHVS
jgi:hypothetical protein